MGKATSESRTALPAGVDPAPYHGDVSSADGPKDKMPGVAFDSRAREVRNFCVRNSQWVIIL